MLSLLCGILALAAFIYIPGTLLTRSFGVSRLYSIALAPVLSTFAYVVLGVVLYRFGVFVAWTGMVLPVFTFAILVYGVSIPVRNRLACTVSEQRDVDLRLLAFALAFNLIVAALVFLGSLDGADSFNQGYDTAHHLSQVAATVQFGNWSTLDVTMDGVNIGGFYPSVLHIYAALLVSCLGLASSCALNATIYLFIAVIYPLGTYMLITSIIPKVRLAPLCCTLLALTFPGFPWAPLRYCPLLANVIGFALMPLALWAFVRCFDAAIGRRARIGRCAFCLVSMAVITVGHPNTLFSAAVFLFPFCLWKLAGALDDISLEGRSKTAIKVLGVAAFVALSAFLWKIVHDMEYFRGVVEYPYDSVLSLKDALTGLVTMRFYWFRTILPLAVLVLVGLVSALRMKECRWLVLTYLIGAFMLVVSLSCDSGPFKSMVCGFWYNHIFRLMAVFSICALPAAGLGLSAVCSFVSSRFGKASGFPVSSAVAMAIALLLVCFPVTYVPGEGVSPRSLAEEMDKLMRVNDWNGGETVYHSEEREFVKQAVGMLPEGALVMNFPYDGSCYAYGLDGLDTYFRSNATPLDEQSAEYIVETRLKDIAHDPEVQAAAKELGITYVIQLDHGLGEGSSTLEPEYTEEGWIGILSIDENTEGFEEVLASGDMRLDRIVYSD